MEKDLAKLWIEPLQSASKLIVVEGKKDRAALENLGINNIYTLNKKPLYACVEEILLLSKDVILLTDLDSEGKKLYSKLKKDLTERGIRIDNYFREFLFKNTKFRQIEGLASSVNKSFNKQTHS